MSEDIKYGNETGKVVWFDSRKGYGFIKVITPGLYCTGSELYVHYTDIKTDGFKKLLPGECVSMDVVSQENEKLKCSNVSGLYGTELLSDNSNWSYRLRSKKSVSD